MRSFKELFEALLKKTFETTREHWNIEESLCLIDKVINIVQLLVQSDGETYCCCEDLPVYMIEISAIYV